ncbi:hypothetical protein SKAU_G00421770 [Synaphobranchus kaupii]|uniref:Hexosyltransferase n=1 Tax=Synaphobranchus kaupii TaxID=118154 RepID=A0A9Q1E6U8_SYNKA|nr:hypothetical protein SKAU_G00421770 [Synaphobranchus kaupii]
MALLRKINRVLLVLLIFMVYLILYSRMHSAPSPPSHTDTRVESGVVGGAVAGAAGRAAGGAVEVEMSEAEDDILIVICAAEERLGGTMANRQQHTQQHGRQRVLLHRYAARQCRVFLKGRVRPDSSRPELLHPLNFVRFYLPLLVVKHRRAIYLDDDVIVQGDIQDLYNTKLQSGHAAAFASDCDLPSEVIRTMGMQTTYMGFLDYRKLEVRELGINPSDCSFNPGVFVADMETWKRQKITKQLETWMLQNYKNNLYSSAMSGGVATPPMLIVFHGKYTSLDPVWHVGHLGWSPDTEYSDASLNEAQLLHWSGRFKPWDYPCVHMELWEKWYVPDPSKRFSLVRPNS